MLVPLLVCLAAGVASAVDPPDVVNLPPALPSLKITVSNFTGVSRGTVVVLCGSCACRTACSVSLSAARCTTTCVPVYLT